MIVSGTEMGNTDLLPVKLFFTLMNVQQKFLGSEKTKRNFIFSCGEAFTYTLLKSMMLRILLFLAIVGNVLASPYDGTEAEMTAHRTRLFQTLKDRSDPDVRPSGNITKVSGDFIINFAGCFNL